MTVESIESPTELQISTVVYRQKFIQKSIKYAQNAKIFQNEHVNFFPEVVTNMMI